MKKYAFVALIGFAMACTAGKHGVATAASSTQDGTSFEAAVVIKETHEPSGVDAEYKWCAEHYPGYKTKMQALVSRNKKPYDVLTIDTEEGQEIKVYFDISTSLGSSDK